MTPHPYLTQILIAIGKGCKSNSPIADRAWVNMKPPRSLKIPELLPAIDALVKAGLVDRAKGHAWKVKPSRVGYAFIESWREDRRAMRERPVLYDPVVRRREMYVIDQRYDHYSHQVVRAA
jgi:hypothetical protein